MKKADIITAHVIEGLLKGGFGVRELGSNPWNTLNIRNRFRRRYVLMEKRGGFRFLAITPDDPDGFVGLLGSSEPARVTES